MEVEWGDGVSKEDKKLIRKSIRQWRRSSETYRKVWKTLKKYDAVYTIKTGKTKSGWSEFDGNNYLTMSVTNESGEQETVKFFDEGQPGGTITINTEVFKGMNFSKDAKLDFLRQPTLEEVVHASQYDFYTSKSGQDINNLEGHSTGFLDFEVEAKTINGIIKQEAGRSFSRDDGILESYGASLIKGSGSISDYYKKASEWVTCPNTNSMYKEMPYKKSKPMLLMQIIIK